MQLKDSPAKKTDTAKAVQEAEEEHSSGGSNSVLKLNPRLLADVSSFLATEKVHELTNALGSPLNLLFPQLLLGNLNQFDSVFEKHQIKGRIYFAHKANRSDCVTRQLASTSAFIDVSSINELRHALASGFEAFRIQATGPKNTEFINLCLQQNVLLSVDSIAELQEIIQLSLHFKRPKPAQILLRISGFKNRQLKHQGKASRFGIKYDDVPHALELLSKCRDRLSLIGLAFHLDTTSSLEKATAIEACFALFEMALDQDFNLRVLNIGGGFKLSYLDQSEDWHEYNSAMREAALGTRAPLTWQGSTFGLLPDRGVLRGSFNSYNFYDPSTGSKFFDEIISHQMESLDGQSIAKFLRDNGIELWIEPGRALLDQVGVTVARVNSIRESSQNDTLVCLNMKRQDLCFIDQEMFVDPIVLYRERISPTSLNEQPVYFAGNLCLESDLITRHQTFLPRLPERGDLVAFINTAGYFMDFSASEAIMQPLARKVAVYKHDNCFCWTLDEEYYPWLSETKERR
jgi:diaminopimelate decarboxylase